MESEVKEDFKSDTENQQHGVSSDIVAGEVKVLETGEIVNASGHKQELERNFSLLNMCAVGIVIGNCWTITGATITLAIYNGGSPGVLYEFIIAAAFYFLITANLAEMASSIPSAGGVYHWASVTPGKRAGRVIGFFAGYWNALAYSFGAASLASVSGKAVVQMYSLHHPDYKPERWHVFICYLIIVWMSCAILLFANRLLPRINNLMMAVVLGGWLITIIVVAVMPSQGGRSHASGNFVWIEWQNNTGYTNNPLVFLLGMLNGAFSIGTPDSTTHMAEEIAKPSKNIPKAMGIQMTCSVVTTFIFLIILFYGISDFHAVLSTTAELPLTEIYLQATGTKAGATGLTVIAVLSLIGSVIGSILTSSRIFWTLARDDATPFSGFFGRVNKKWKNPFNAIIFDGCFCTVMGCIYLGSDVAFEAFSGSFVVLTTLSYLAALLPFLLKKRATIAPGPFFIKGIAGFIVNAVSCAYMIVFIVFYCFPYSLPVSAENMNYSCLIAGGLTIILGGWWFWVQGRYEGPPILV